MHSSPGDSQKQKEHKQQAWQRANDFEMFFIQFLVLKHPQQKARIDKAAAVPAPINAENQPFLLVGKGVYTKGLED